MKLLVGLGNPGPKYAGHRHNVGFMAVDRIWASQGFSPWRRRFSGQVAEGRLAGERCLLLKPETYMNESGRAVGEAVRYYKLSPEDVIVIHDELDLKPGKLRVKTGGGHAGHNGLRSISAHIGADYRRLRIGIGHPGDKSRVQGYVLHDFSREDHDWLEPLLDAIAAHADRLVVGDDTGFLNAVYRQLPDGTRSRSSELSPKAAPQRGGEKSAGSQKATVRSRERTNKPSTSGETEEQDGPLAQALKRWLSGKRDRDGE